MLFSARNKFAGFLRGLVGRPDDRAQARAEASAAPAPASAPASKLASAGHGGQQRSANPNEIEISLAPLITSLPTEFRSKVMGGVPPSHIINLPVDNVLSQLAFGAVKITFGELRRLAPRVFAASGGELDNKLVNIPLQQILPRMNMGLLVLRCTKRVEVSDDILGPFSERGRGFSFTTAPLKPSQITQVPAPEPEPEPAAMPAPIQASAPIAFNPPQTFRPAAPASVAPTIPQRATTPAAPANGTSNGYGHSFPTQQFPQRSVAPAPSAGVGGGMGANGDGNRNGHSNGYSNGHSAPAGLRIGPLNGNGPAEAPAPAAPAPASAPAPQRPVPQGPMVNVVLGSLAEAWPDSVKAEIAQLQISQATIALDGAMVLPALKRGRVVMPWHYLRSLAVSNAGSSPIDNLELELPLKVIAPLFMAAQKAPVRPHSKGRLVTDIPDLFFGFPQPSQPAAVAPAAPPAPVAPAAPVPPVPQIPQLPLAAPTAPAPAQSLPPASLAPAAAPVAPMIPPLPRPADRANDTNYFSRDDEAEASAVGDVFKRNEPPATDFLNRQTHPKDVVAKAVSLPGVAGSVVAMADGMRVASQVPVELNADTVAAFLPQIFDRVNQCTRELRMGPLNNVNFTVGNVPWKIFRVNAVYFAVFGRAGEQFPSAQLAQLAADLDRKK